MYLQSAVHDAGVVNKAQLSRAVHKKTNSRTGGANHLRRSLLADLGNDRFGTPVQIG